jgi:hypothetical protein
VNTSLHHHVASRQTIMAISGQYGLLELNMLCDCVTRGCGDHSPLTTAAILEWSYLVNTPVGRAAAMEIAG